MSNKADAGEGSCKEVLTGQFKGYWRVQFRKRLPNGGQQRISRLFKTKTAARAHLQELRREPILPNPIPQPARRAIMTLGEMLEFLTTEDWPDSVASVSIEMRRRRFAKYVPKDLASTPLDQIDPLDVRTFYRALKASGVSDSLIVDLKSDLVRIFNQAVSPYQRVPMTLANPFRLPVPQPKPREAVALTPEQIRAALRCKNLTVSQHALLALFLLAGVRLGEQMAMTRGQLRFDDNLIVIDRAVQVGFNGKQTVGLPKVGKIRSAVMCPTLKRILLAHAGDMEPDHVLWAAATENKPRMKKLTYATWRVIVKEAKLPFEMSPHDARLSFTNVILKLAHNASQVTLKEHLGHSVGATVTEQHYTRPISTAQAVLRDEIERILGID